MAATLLVADDSVTIQRVIELTFADEAVRVVSAGDGQAALQKIDAERPDIVLADVGMPRVDGYAVASHVKQTPALRHIPVVLLTGAFEPIDEDRARATGCDGILVKPFEPQVLVARVRELLGGQRSAALWPDELPRVEARAADRPALRPSETAVMTPTPVAPRPVVDLPGPPTPPSLDGPPTPAMAAPPMGPDVADEPLMAPQDHFESELDLLDEAFAKLDPAAIPKTLDAETASDFARDLHELRADRVVPSPVSTGDVSHEDAAPAGGPPFDGWDLPTRGRAAEAADVAHVEADRPEGVAPEPEPVATPLAETSTVAAPPAVVLAPTPVVPPPAPVNRPSLATAFSALLAAERAQPPRRPLAGRAGLSEAAIEDVVKQVLARVTDDRVQKAVLEVAERVIKEEIARIKTNPPNA